MKKNITLSMIATVALVSLVGCGGGSTPSANTGTGYYIDNAVAGVDYVCGTQKGKTDKDGKFIFEKGQECSFKLAGIPLRTTPASELQDGKKVLEDNPKVAKFLQSIDGDGDLSNGIQITDEVLDALTTALDTLKVPKNTVPDGQNLTEVVAEVGDKVENVSGDIPTDEEVQTHLTQTQTEITKELLAGKTFYFINSRGTISEAIVNSDATTIKLGDDPETPITIEGNKVTDKNGDHFIDKVTDKYILGHNNNHNEFKLYFKKSDAEAALGDSGTGSNDLTSLIVGKTYYTATHDSYTDGHGNLINNDHVEELTFNADGHTVTDRWTQKNGETKTSTFNYSIEDNSLNLNGIDGDGKSFNITFNTPITQTDTYIQFANHGKFFKTYAAAEAALGDSGTSNFNFSDIGSDTTALSSPNGGEKWIIGQAETINWNTSSITGSKVNLYVLHDDPSNLHDFSSSLNNLLTNKNWYQFGTDISNTGTYTVDPKNLNGEGNAYVILISGTQNGWDVSDSTITLSSN